MFHMVGEVADERDVHACGLQGGRSQRYAPADCAV